MVVLHGRRGRRALSLMSAAAMLCLAIPTPSCRTEQETILQPPAAASSATPSWTSDAERTLAEREYEATESNAGLQAPNRAHGLRAYFEAGGVRVVDREDATRELARIRTVSVGRGSAARSVTEGEVRSEGPEIR